MYWPIFTKSGMAINSGWHSVLYKLLPSWVGSKVKIEFPPHKRYSASVTGNKQLMLNVAVTAARLLIPDICKRYRSLYMALAYQYLQLTATWQFELPHIRGIVFHAPEVLKSTGLWRLCYHHKRSQCRLSFKHRQMYNPASVPPNYRRDPRRQPMCAWVKQHDGENS
jgi:hypothetical protein